MENIDELSVKDIKSMIGKLNIEDKIKYIELLNKDTRKSVQKIKNDIIKEKQKFDDEINRINKLWDFEKNLNEGERYVAGIDEVGRGPLAGPVVTAAVILKKNDIFEGINDSKKVSRANRERLFIDIMDRAISIGIGIVGEKIIDEINILEATKVAMKKAVENLDIKPELLLIDALKLDDIDIKQFGIIKGDMKSISIAAASIIAKVTRDKIMYEYNNKYPGYGFLTNVGYGTKEHIDAIKKIGYTEIHRKTFIKNFIE
jgi:ribonuclease HII